MLKVMNKMLKAMLLSTINFDCYEIIIPQQYTF